jgi:hypothetical protein
MIKGKGYKGMDADIDHPKQHYGACRVHVCPLAISFHVWFISQLTVSHGDMLIGTTINILLYGIMITQMYIYYTTYQR